MKNTIALAAVLLISSGFAVAQEASVNTNAVSGAASKSASGAASLGNHTTVTVPLTMTETSTSKGSDLDETVPNVFAPALTAGSNNCALSVSGGASGAGFGVSLAAAYESGECNVRESLRVMGGMLRTENNPQAASILKAVACQSVIYWDSLELAAIEIGNADLACKNERPKELGRFELRTPQQLPASYPAMVANDGVKLETHNAVAQRSQQNSNCFSEEYCY